jgi:hypothetical protein
VGLIRELRVQAAKLDASPFRRATARMWLWLVASTLSSFPVLGFAEAAPSPANAPIATARSSTVEQVYVFGKRKEGIGVSVSASEGEVSFAKFADRPLMRPGELVEVIPGMVATQHSGSTKANQYFLRGFNLDHGTDFSVSFDGVPLNLRTHAHGQGYLDLNGIIPEVIETIKYRKGPYYADQGDFSNAGGAAFQTFSNNAPSFVEAMAGENSYGRLLIVKSLGARGFLAGELDTYRGPYDHPDNFRKIDLIGRVGVGDWSITGLAYAARTHANDQIPERAVKEGLISSLGALDPTDGAKTTRFIVSAQRTKDDGWGANVYVQHYTLSLFSNFTYFLRDPINGDQFEQYDDRWIYGGSFTRTWPTKVLGFTMRTGLEVRDDDIGKVALYDTHQRQILYTVRSDRVNEYSGTVWSDASRSFGPVRISAGLRLDDAGGHVHSDDPRNSGTTNAVLLSPKFTAAWIIYPDVELYADAGQGFHTNDIRGGTITVVPGTNVPAPKVPLISASQGAELGARFSGGGLSATASLWTLHLDSELVYNGDGGDTASTGATQRTGVELLLDYAPTPRLDFNFSAAESDAHYSGNPPGGNRIPNALEYVLTGGVTARVTDHATVTITGRRLGPAPLIEDNSARSNTATLFNALLDYDFGRFQIKLECLNLFDSKDNEIQYFYTSRLKGEPADGVNDYHFHRFEPRTFRVTLRVPLD